MKKIRYLGYRVTINYGSDQFCSLRENYVIAARALPDAGPEHLLLYTLNKVNNSMPKHNMYSAVLHNKLSIGKKKTKNKNNTHKIYFLRNAFTTSIFKYG